MKKFRLYTGSDENGLLKKMWALVEKSDKTPLVIWALDCADRVLPLFETVYPGDQRPRRALETGRGWIGGKQTVPEARRAAVDAHASARNAIDDPARAAARACANAVAACHARNHSFAAAVYAATAVGLASDSRTFVDSIQKERVRQWERLQEILSTNA